MDQLWNIGIDPWIIADGNYDHFVKGQVAEFALEFNPNEIELSSLRLGTSCQPEGDEYLIHGEITTCCSDAWVVNFGISAFHNLPPPKEFHVGDYVHGRLKLHVDPFFYFEELSRRETMPPLVYTWEIERITILSAPLILHVDPSWGEIWKPSVENQRRIEVYSTDVHKYSDFGYIQDGSSIRPTHSISYLLHCTRCDVPPKRNSVTARHCSVLQGT